ncbi:hypothetical protein ACHAXS_008688 [Conticribra weissflogii]
MWQVMKQVEILMQQCQGFISPIMVSQTLSLK